MKASSWEVQQEPTYTTYRICDTDRELMWKLLTYHFDTDPSSEEFQNRFHTPSLQYDAGNVQPTQEDVRQAHHAFGWNTSSRTNQNQQMHLELSQQRNGNVDASALREANFLLYQQAAAMSSTEDGVMGDVDNGCYPHNTVLGAESYSWHFIGDL